ncbi:hypothetical protein [Actinophytocola sp. NPDC049390]|uniref:hypothetical protein n=1 Tax=Actinophytocola sp. NPDC049390 TaxID=3363894 RepID=UPI00378D2D01
MFRWILPAAAVAGALVLSACGGDAESTAPATTEATETSATAETTTEESAAPSESASAGAAELTPQGTALAMGEKAVVPFHASGEKGLVGVTITKIDKGAPADLAPLKLGARADGYTPYYIRITVSNESGTDFAGSSIVTLDGLLADGSDAGGVYSVPSSFTPCGKGSAGDDFVTAGTTYETCSLALAPEGTEVTGVAYDIDTYDDAAPAGAKADYAAEPITWK